MKKLANFWPQPFGLGLQWAISARILNSHGEEVQEEPGTWRACCSNGFPLLTPLQQGASLVLSNSAQGTRRRLFPGIPLFPLFLGLLRELSQNQRPAPKERQDIARGVSPGITGWLQVRALKGPTQRVPPLQSSSANETRIQGLTPLAIFCRSFGAGRAQLVPWEPEGGSRRRRRKS